jgi:hypothetical protein
MTARRRLAFFDPGPVDLDPVVDRGLVAFGRATAGALHRPAHAVAQQPPHVRRVVAHPGQPPDQFGDAVQGPQLALEPVGGGARKQGLLDAGKLLVAKPWGGPGRPAACKGAGAAGLPGGVPAAGGLAGDAEPAGDLGRVDTSGEQLAGAQPAGLQLLALAVGLGAAGGRLASGAPVAAAVEFRPHAYTTSTQSPKTFGCGSFRGTC